MSNPSSVSTSDSSSSATTTEAENGNGNSAGPGGGGEETMQGLKYDPERKDELAHNYEHTLQLVRAAFSHRNDFDASTSSPSSPQTPSSSRSLSLSSLSLSPSPTSASSRTNAPPLLLPISKLKPASDIVALYDLGVRDFGENYVQELQEKAELLKHLEGIRWHFVGGLQSNKCKALAAIPNLYAVHAIDSSKKADVLDRSLSSSSSSPSSQQLSVYIQINTSSEPQKSGLPPPFSPPSNSSGPSPVPSTSAPSSSARPSSAVPGSTAALDLATHIATRCPRLRLVGLMTIGAADGDPEVDFGVLRKARERTEKHLRAMAVNPSCVGRRRDVGSGEREMEGGGEGEEGEVKLELSMGMSADFEKAVQMGSDCVRVGTGIFGKRPEKKDAKII